ncbi:MAG: sulfotransferase [Deltaproteobacteria bacterium]|nr:sulfotransferase [Deltaproteobacteria bacterium]
MKPIFIIGGSRTGSTFLQHFFNNYTDIDIMPEAHILAQPWLHKDFARAVKDNIGDLRKDGDINKLIDLMYSKKLYGVFWDGIKTSGIDISSLKDRIIDSDRSINNIFSALLVAHAEAKNKTICGAKFPVPMLYVDKLIAWYPECKIIHTVRDPRACFSSQFYKHYNEKNNSIKKVKVSLAQFVYMNLQFHWSYNMYNELKNAENYFLCKYEDLILRSEKTTKALCSFLEIPFTKKMLNPRLTSISSYSETRGKNKGFQAASVYAWKNKMPGVVSELIKIINYRLMKKLDYW